jgi:hypothetical protein
MLKIARLQMARAKGFLVTNTTSKATFLCLTKETIMNTRELCELDGC